MTEERKTDHAADRHASDYHDHDRLTRFLLPEAGVRGVHVRLDETWRQIRNRSDYPPAVRELLGEACAAAALFTGHTKVEGRLSIQLRGEGALRTLFAECTAAGTLRGIARMADDAEAVISRDLLALGGTSLLAITIENPARGGREPMRYQGLVPIESESLDDAFESYFRQSEQLPTRLLLVAGDDTVAGLMLQQLPFDGPPSDSRPADNRLSDDGSDNVRDEDGWNRAGALFDTLRPDELLGLPAGTVLYRLFHEEQVQLLGERPLSFACSCSRERVAAMLEALGPEEARASLADGEATVRCEFCGQLYRFGPADIDAIFTPVSLQSPSPERVQ
jgi:molecular chaperone Hsp33